MRLSLAAVVFAAIASTNLHAGMVGITGGWTGAPYSNGATVTLAADIDLSNPAFDLGPTAGKAHQWWWATGPTTITNMVVFVMGATIDTNDNAIFDTTAFNWFRIASNAATSDLALTDLTNIIDLGNSGTEWTGAERFRGWRYATGRRQRRP